MSFLLKSQNLACTQPAGECLELQVVMRLGFGGFLMENSELLPDVISSRFLSH